MPYKASYWRHLRCLACFRSCAYDEFRPLGSNAFQRFRQALYVDSDDPKQWRYKRRGTVLGQMHATKRRLWEQFTEACASRSEEERKAILDD